MIIGGCIQSSQFEEIADIYDQIRSWNISLRANSISDTKLA